MSSWPPGLCRISDMTLENILNTFSRFDIRPFPSFPNTAYVTSINWNFLIPLFHKCRHCATVVQLLFGVLLETVSAVNSTSNGLKCFFNCSHSHKAFQFMRKEQVWKRSPLQCFWNLLSMISNSASRGSILLSHRRLLPGFYKLLKWAAHFIKSKHCSLPEILLDKTNVAFLTTLFFGPGCDLLWGQFHQDGFFDASDIYDTWRVSNTSTQKLSMATHIKTDRDISCFLDASTHLQHGSMPATSKIYIVEIWTNPEPVLNSLLTRWTAVASSDIFCSVHHGRCFLFRFSKQPQQPRWNSQYLSSPRMTTTMSPLLGAESTKQK